jgi:hypothetical protein
MQGLCGIGEPGIADPAGTPALMKPVPEMGKVWDRLFDIVALHY